MPSWEKVVEVYTATEAQEIIAQACAVLQDNKNNSSEKAQLLATFLKTKNVQLTEHNITDMPSLHFGSIQSTDTRTFVNNRPIDWQQVEAWLGDKGYILRRRTLMDGAFDSVCPVYFIADSDGEVIAEGKGLTDEQARRSAMSEALERLLGVAVPQEVTTGTYENLYKNKQWNLGQLSGPRDTFAKNIPTEWISARNITQDEACYLPAEVVHFGYTPEHTKTRLFSLHHTTGLAAGSSAEEATLNGLFEVLERDAYWITMRCKINCPDIDLQKVNGLTPAIITIVETLKQKGFRLSIKDMSLDWGIPIAHAVLQDQNGKLPAFTHGTGAGFSWTVAVGRAVCEVLQMYAGQSAVMQEPSYVKEVAAVGNAVAYGELIWSDPLFIKNIEHLTTPSSASWESDEKILSVEALLKHLATRGHEVLVAKVGEAAGIVVVRVVVTNSTQPDPRLERISPRLEMWRKKEGLPGFYTDTILT